MVSKYWSSQPNTAKHFRAITYDYDMLSTYSDESRLYCLTDFQVAWIESNLPYYNWMTRWRNTNATQTDLNEQQNALELALMSCLQLQPYQIEFTYAKAVDAQLAVYDALYDSGGIAELNENTPTDYYSGDDSSDRIDALCTAITIYIKSYATNWIAKAQIVLGITIVVSASLALTGVGGLIAGTILAGLALFTQTALDAMNDESAIDDVICCMLDALNGADITQVNFTESLDDCGFGGGTNEQIIVDIISTDLPLFNNWLSFLNSLGDSYVLAQLGVVDCPCETEWTHVIGESGDSWGDYSSLTTGTYLVPENWLSNNSVRDDCSIIFPIGYLEDATLLDIEVFYYQGRQAVTADFKLFVDTTEVLTIDNEIGNKTINHTYSPEVTTDEEFTIYIDVGLPSGYYATLKKLTFHGTGVNPFL